MCSLCWASNAGVKFSLSDGDSPWACMMGYVGVCVTVYNGLLASLGLCSRRMHMERFRGLCSRLVLNPEWFPH